MIKNPRNLLWLIPLLLFLTSPIWEPKAASFLRPRGTFEAVIKRDKAQEISQNFIMDSLTITMSTMGRVDWIINAKRAFSGKTDRDIGMTGVDALYTAKDNTKTHITSDRGTYIIDQRHLSLIDNVILRKPSQNHELFTDLLHYYDATKMAVSPGKVEIKAPNFSIQAGRMDYDLSSDAYDLSDRVLCIF